MELDFTAMKFIALAAALWFVISAIGTVVIYSVGYRSVLMTSRPTWTYLLSLAVFWCVSLKVAYYFVYQGSTFYGG